MPVPRAKSSVHIPVPRPTATEEREPDEPLETREICEEIALKLAEHPASVHVSEQRHSAVINGHEEKRLALKIHCHPDDIGQMVGKKAALIHLLEALLTRCEWRNHLVVTVDVDRPPEDTSTAKE